MQAFVVTSGLCLGIDLVHRSERDPEAVKDHQGIQKAIKILQRW